MKCNNCGWQNDGKALRCARCNVLLQGSMLLHGGGGNNNLANSGELTCLNCGCANDPGSLKCAQCNALLQGSIIYTPGEDSPPMQKDAGKTVATVNIKPNICPGCSYPNVGGVQNCVSCGKELAQAGVAAKKGGGTSQTPLPDGNKTINPWASQTQSEIRLQPLSHEFGEEGSPVVFGGNLVTLNRQNLAPENRTLTKGVQATLVCKNGKWHISNGGKRQASFVLVRGEMELQKGDVVLFGNKMYSIDFDLGTGQK